MVRRQHQGELEELMQEAHSLLDYPQDYFKGTLYGRGYLSLWQSLQAVGPFPRVL